MKAVEERDELLATSCVHREFQCGLDSFRATVGEMRARRRFDGDDRIEFLCELRHLTVVIIGAAHVNQLFCLLLNGFDDFRMAVAGRTDRHTRVAVEKNVTVNVLDPNATTAFGDEFKGWARVSGINKFGICFNDLLTFRTGQLGLDFRAAGCDCSGRHILTPYQKGPMSRDEYDSMDRGRLICEEVRARLSWAEM